MKTLAELNSKWYWRLLKVIYIFISIFVITSIVFFNYHPDRYFEEPFNKKMENKKLEFIESLKRSNYEENSINSVMKGLKEEGKFSFNQDEALKDLFLDGRNLILVIFLIGFFTYIAQGALFYIILGKFNPQK